MSKPKAPKVSDAELAKVKEAWGHGLSKAGDPKAAQEANDAIRAQQDAVKPWPGLPTKSPTGPGTKKS